MFKNTFQSGFLSILYSIGSKPLQIWDKKVRNGHIKRITDNDIQSFVLEILGTNVSTTFITCPADPRKTLGIRLPFLIMIVKNMKKYFTFEVQILDDKNVRRRFRASNFQSTTRVKPFICTMPMRLDEGWNQIQFNLADFTRRAYGTSYVETLRVQTVLSQLLWPGGTGSASAHAMPYTMYHAMDEGQRGDIFPVFGGFMLMWHHRMKPLCFRLCTINTLHVSDSCAVFLLLTASNAFVPRITG
ncbi:cilia- and flagella-associated protein 20 isoform X1 [Dermacentor andersoni]|uniref:cilia- and flagella-associated protein 20 isoform X1 n=1 Tax=Dermacentor andersoni TaxID=34620 RepID=UPI0024163DA7|nr:cilia- and flagella-associated protein 20 isoform X1 [Dermacentor andersoni]